MEISKYSNVWKQIMFMGKILINYIITILSYLYKSIPIFGCKSEKLYIKNENNTTSLSFVSPSQFNEEYFSVLYMRVVLQTVN